MYSFHHKYNLVTVKECKLCTEADEQGSYEKNKLPRNLKQGTGCVCSVSLFHIFLSTTLPTRAQFVCLCHQHVYCHHVPYQSMDTSYLCYERLLHPWCLYLCTSKKKLHLHLPANNLHSTSLSPPLLLKVPFFTVLLKSTSAFHHAQPAIQRDGANNKLKKKRRLNQSHSMACVVLSWAKLKIKSSFY